MLFFKRHYNISTILIQIIGFEIISEFLHQLIQFCQTCWNEIQWDFGNIHKTSQDEVYLRQGFLFVILGPISRTFAELYKFQTKFDIEYQVGIMGRKKSIRLEIPTSNARGKIN